MRLDKYLADCGAGSRKEIRAFIKAGRVLVDGQSVSDAGMQVEESSRVVLDGIPVNYRKYVYLMLNKPAGVVSANVDKHLPTVFGLIDPKYRRYHLSCVGRLDRDTTGLLLLTNDGDLTHGLISPKRHVAKTYLARIKGLVTEEDTKKFADGIVLADGCCCLPGKLEIINTGAESDIALTIYEGKFHQVKRMFEAVGKKVLRLHRCEVAGVRLDDKLREGQARELTDREVEILKNAGQPCKKLTESIDGLGDLC